MNKIKHFLTLLLLSLALSTSAFAQKAFEGKIVFGIKVMGENADQMAAFMPESYEYRIKGNNMLFKINGGMTAAILGEILVNGEEETTYMLKADEQVAYKMLSSEADETESVAPNVTKQDEVIDIMGYKCQKYQVKVTDEEGVEATQYMWCTDEIVFKRPSDTKAMGGGNLFMEGVGGFPLKIMTETMGMTMVMTAIEISPKTLSDSDFAVPSNYEIKDFDPQSLMGGMGR